jgi:hypothetical protein
MREGLPPIFIVPGRFVETLKPFVREASTRFAEIRAVVILPGQPRRAEHRKVHNPLESLGMRLFSTIDVDNCKGPESRVLY